MNEASDAHGRDILHQFTRQAAGFREFAETPGEPREIVVAATEVDGHDTVLDVACGPGVATCDLAAVARHATGIDVTPAMIEQAKEVQRARGLTNLTWLVDAVPPLPFGDETFSLVFTRYSFHHFADPLAVLREMSRVCIAGGRIAVVDVFMSTVEQADAFNRMEKLRDPSHVRAFLLDELEHFFAAAGLEDPTKVFYRQPMTLQTLLRGSFPRPGDDERVRQIIVDDAEKNELGLGVRRVDDDFHFAYPIAVLVARKKAGGA